MQEEKRTPYTRAGWMDKKLNPVDGSIIYGDISFQTFDRWRLSYSAIMDGGSPGLTRRGLPKFRELLRRPRGESDVRLLEAA